jgi:uncharacterized protein
MVDITPLVPGNRQVIERYGESGFRISGVAWTSSVLVRPTRTLAWDVTRLEDITEDSLAPFFDGTVEVLLIGCGARIAMIPPKLRAAIRARGPVIDAMDTGAACRTYNVLLAEDRRVAAALIRL